jgi:tetratricopeptide (TPR) repeat protein
MDHSKAIYELYRGGKVQQALLVAEEWFEAAGSLEALVEYVQLLLSQRFYEKAESVLEAFPQSAAESQQIYHLYHDLYVQSGRVDDLQGLQSLFSDLQLPGSLGGVSTASTRSTLRPDSFYFADQLCALCRSHSETIPELADVATEVEMMVQSGDTPGAIQTLRRVSDNIEDENSRYLLRAEISLVRGQYRTAEKRYRRLKDKFPTGTLVLNRLGDICLATGRPKEAATYYIQACASDPGDLDSARDLIRTHLIEGDIRAAKRAYIEASGRFGNQAVEDFREAITQSKTSQPVKTVNGLSWFEGGGGVLPIEVLGKPGDGRLQTTGQIGFSMQDSVLIAHNLARELAAKDGKPAEALDIHIHVPESVIYKDGPSAGLAFTAGVYGVLVGAPPGASAAFTGEVAPSGRVARVGGIAEKMGAAYFAGLTDIFLPAGNLPDLGCVPPQVKQHLNFHLISTVEQMKEIAWGR